MSDKIFVKGRMIKCDSCMSLNPEDKATCEIELSPPTPSEISNLKEGDEVLVKVKRCKKEYNCGVCADENIVAILKE